ncbi:hypothetical protein OG905_02000 [Streptomyces sp. NBC_00322]
MEELYRRHREPALSYAYTCFRDPRSTEDLTSEVFARAVREARSGCGPTVAWRPSLLTVVRRAAASWAGTARRTELSHNRCNGSRSQLWETVPFKEAPGNSRLRNGASGGCTPTITAASSGCTGTPSTSPSPWARAEPRGKGGCSASISSRPRAATAVVFCAPNSAPASPGTRCSSACSPGWEGNAPSGAGRAGRAHVQLLRRRTALLSRRRPGIRIGSALTPPSTRRSDARIIS